ncbi:membrane-like protein [Sphingobium estronivorans]|uniref:membrane-like protein n=1 Tax=Sphingobium estronivorans TaxID=1577690 RepID=UPI00123B43AC|nr:membrane-like protein [Sphingobium estronivorans]
MTGCGSGEKDVPVSNAARRQASVPIILPNQSVKQNTENVSEAVPRETAAPHSAPSPAPERPAQGRYRAIGTEPFWAVTVKGSTATLERPDKAPVRFAVSRYNDGRTIRYLGGGFSMTLSEGPCSDGMSDAIWSDRVAIAFGEGTLDGCGGARDDQDAGAP